MRNKSLRTLPSMYMLFGGWIFRHVGAIPNTVCRAMLESVVRNLSNLVDCAAGQQ